MSLCVNASRANKKLPLTNERFDSHTLFLKEPQWDVSASVQIWGAIWAAQSVSYVPDEILQRKKKKLSPQI